MTPWRSFGRYSALLIRLTYPDWILLLVSAFLLVLSEGVGLWMLIPMLQLMGLEVEGGYLGDSLQKMQKVAAWGGLQLGLGPVLVGFVAVVTARALMVRWNTVLNASLQQRLVSHLRESLHQAILSSDWLFFIRQRSSDFVHTLTSEVERVGGATHHLLQLMVGGAVCLLYLLFALRISFPLTLLVALVGLALMLILRGRIERAQRAGRKLSAEMRRLYGAVEGHLAAMKVAKSYGAERAHERAFQKLSRGVREAYLATMAEQADRRLGFEIGSAGALALVLWASLRIQALSGAEVVFLILLFSRLLPKFSDLQAGLQSFVSLWPSLENVMRCLQTCQEARDAAQDPAASGELPFRDSVQIQGVVFGYPEKEVFSCLDLTIRAGELTALVGPSGAGKTTVVDLLMGLVVPQQGVILVDGRPLEPDRLHLWRRQVAYVPQETFLFHDTVRANLLWAHPQAREEELWEALDRAAAREFVRSLPGHLEAVIGDRGVRLSAGQRQRLALARALLRKPSLLILDEATSSLDRRTEAKILRNLKQLQEQGLAILLVSHRLSALRGAQRVYLMKSGRAWAKGSWRDLLGSRQKGALPFSRARAGTV